VGLVEPHSIFFRLESKPQRRPRQVNGTAAAATAAAAAAAMRLLLMMVTMIMMPLRGSCAT
jgi:hypothetical protein